MLIVRVLSLSSALCGLLACAGCNFATPSADGEAALTSETQRLPATVAWSEQPPDQFLVAEVPQFVAVTFDDNFISGLGDVKGGMTWVTDLFRDKTNPAGNGTVGTFDGTPVRTSFFFTSLYIETDDGNRTAWRTAVTDGHEAADHTVQHRDGTEFSASDWQGEIGTCRDELVSPTIGIGVAASDIIGFRSPYLAYNPNLVPVLQQDNLVYDSSVQSCWQDSENGTNCAWPYTLDAGSPDADTVTEKFQRPALSTNPGFWEIPLPALIVPSDDLVAQYGIAPGLRDRIPPAMPLPSFYEKATGKIAALDVTLFVDAGLTATEVLGVLKYNLDLHLKGNRSPLVFVSHSHVYADNYTAATNALSVSDRQGAIASFLDYALSKPEVRMRPLRDLVNWLRAPTALNGVRLPRPDGGAGGNAGVGGAADAGGAAGSGGTLGGGAASSGASGANAAGASLGGPESVGNESSCRIGTKRAPGSGWFGGAWLLAAVFRRRKPVRALVTFARVKRPRILGG